VNFLTHVFLSGDNFPLAVGNLIADQINKKEIETFPVEIQKGIQLHHSIDAFTDSHPVFKNCVSELFPKYRHYSRVIVDMYFDHFLAVHWETFHPQPLSKFSSLFYEELHRSNFEFSEQLNRFILALTSYNWFEQYSTVEGLGGVLAQMDNRTSFNSNLADSTADLIEKYSYFESQFLAFIKPLIAFTKIKLIQL
jgi:acyl carrier protein phosphodiesterase